MSLTQDLIRFIEKNLLEDSDGASIDENELLIDRGIIDSIGLMKIMLFIEDKTNLRVPDDEVMPENFQTVSSIVRMVDLLRFSN